ncbi:MAG: VWA domain-containing protein, partial [Pseudomonadota bacterium]
VQMTVACIVWGLLVVALMRPERIGEPVEMTRAARDLVLAIDISGSMDERDFRTGDGRPLQRLEAVKGIVGTFVEQRQGDRVSLIVFGSKAFVQAPFTEDLQSVRALLEQTAVGMAGPNTVIGDAIGLAIRTFETSEVDQRLMILLSDGADTNSRMSPVNAAEIAADMGVEIHTVAVGDPGGTGENKVDLPQLRDIAERAGGEFFFAGDADELARIYARIEELAPRKVQTLSFRPRAPVGHWPLIAAIGLVLAAVTWLHATGPARGRA